MLLTIYVIFSILAWVTIIAGLVTGMFRDNLTTKGPTLLLFLFGMVLSLFLATESFNIEVFGCTSAACGTTQYASEYVAYFYWVIAFLCLILAGFYTFVEFGMQVRNTVKGR